MESGTSIVGIFWKRDEMHDARYQTWNRTWTRGYLYIDRRIYLTQDENSITGTIKKSKIYKLDPSLILSGPHLPIPQFKPLVQ